MGLFRLLQRNSFHLGYCGGKAQVSYNMFGDNNIKVAAANFDSLVLITLPRLVT